MRKGSGEKMGVPQGAESDGEHTPHTHAVGPKEGPKEGAQGLGLGPLGLGRQSPQPRGLFPRGPALPRAPWWGRAHQPCVRACPYHLPAVTTVPLHLWALSSFCCGKGASPAAFEGGDGWAPGLDT